MPNWWAAAICSSRLASDSVGLQPLAALLQRYTVLESCLSAHHHTNRLMVLIPSWWRRCTSAALLCGSTLGIDIPATLPMVPLGTTVTPWGGAGAFGGGGVVPTAAAGRPAPRPVRATTRTDTARARRIRARRVRSRPASTMLRL